MKKTIVFLLFLQEFTFNVTTQTIGVQELRNESILLENSTEQTICEGKNDRCDKNLENIHSVSIPTPFMSSKDATDTETAAAAAASSVINGKIIYKNNTKSFTRNSGLPFLEIPKGDDMRIQELRLDEEYLIFGAFSTLMRFLQPAGFSSDLLRQILNNRIPPYLVAFQVFKMDIIFILWLIIWLTLSLCLPIAIIARVCCTKGVQRLEDDYSIGPFLSTKKCTIRILGYSLHILLFLLIPSIVVILAANEQISKSISKSPQATNIIYDDINTFVRNTHLQISFVVSSSIDIAIEDVKEDMEAVTELLGEPYQQELAVEAGIDLALVELDELKLTSAKVTSIVSDVISDCAAARIVATLLQEKLDDISLQLTVAKQQCNLKDRALCYTLQQSGFEVSFDIQNLTNDPKIRHLDTLAREDALNVSVDGARKSFSSIPGQVALETTPYIAEARAILQRKRTEVYKSTHALDVLTRSLSDTLLLSQESILAVMHKLVNFDFWRWSAVLGITSFISLIWGLMLCGAPCGCGVTSRTVSFLLAGVGISCFIILLAWAMGSVSVFFGGHGNGLLCNPLFDSPNYSELGEFLDTDSIFFKNGIFEDFTDNNDTIEIANVLKHCQRDYPAYQTFHLNNTINIDKILNHKQWRDLTALFANLTEGECNLELLSPSLQLNLQSLLSASTVNLTLYRLQLSSPLTKKDLNTFADQLNTVARQITEASSSRKIDNIAFTVRKIIQNEMKNLMEIKNSILYKITALEVLMPPLIKQVNNSLENLKNVQFFLDTKGSQVAKKVRSRFVKRLTSYLEDLFNYVTKKVSKEIGKCRPLWEIFHSSRFYACKLIVDPLNAIAFSSFLVILIFLTLAPIVLTLIQHYRRFEDDFSSQSNGLLDEESAWASPVSGTPPEIQLVESAPPPPPPVLFERSAIATWNTPTPPRPPTISERIRQSPRIPQIPTISISKTSKISAISSRILKARDRRNHESLKLVEPIRWKVGSTTPKSWI